jgi:hypothetical protein
MSDGHWRACWPSGQEGLVVADVAAQTDQVLLAVHQPPRLKEMPVPLPGQRAEAIAQARDADQEELLERLVTPEPREHTLVIPIIGEPGTGKSHIIKWLRAAIPRSDDLVIRHIPREGTSLPQVVRILLEGLEGGRFDEVRKQMDIAKSQITSLEEAANHLALRIAGLVQFGIPSGWRRAAHIDDELRESLCNPTVLPALLTDYACRTHLTRVGGPIHRLAEDIVEGYRRSDEGDDEELGFHPEDLAFTNASLRGAGTAAKRAVLNLQMEGVAAASAAILSDALDVAAQDVIGLGGVSLTDVFSDLRAELLEHGKELVLLFEDMAIMRGLQLDLVDAITTPAVRDGKQLLCTLRVALAITPTYWDEQAPETLATRVHSWGGRMFSLDVLASETEEIAATLIGRYLNAARVGIDHLEAQEASVNMPVSNKCDDCPFDIRDECHAIFGKTAEGHGLFPLSRAAATTASRLANRRTFRPRTVLSEVVGPVISDRLRLNDGSFPSANGDIRRLVEGAIQRRALNDLSLGQLEALEQAQLSEGDRARAETVLRIWDARTSADPVGLLAALNLPDLVSGVTDTPTPQVEKPEQPPEPGDTANPLDEELRAIEQWAGGSFELPAGVARTVRGALFDELRAGIRWDELGFGLENVLGALDIAGRQVTNRAVRIEMTAGGGTTGTATPLIVVKPNVATAQLLSGLLLRNRNKSWAFPGGTDALARVRVVVRQVEDDIAKRLAAKAFSPKTVTDAAQVLVLAATGFGIATPTADAPLDGSLVPSESLPTPVERSREWLALAQEARRIHKTSSDAVLRAAGRRQGPGAAITAFDWTLVDGKRLTRSGSSLLGSPKGEDAKLLYREFLQAAEVALNAEADAIESVVHAIEERIGAGVALTLKTIRDAANETIETAKAAHVLRRGDLLDEIAQLELPPSVAAADLLEEARRAVTAARGGVSTEALSRTARLDVAALKEIARYLELLDDLVTGSIDAAREVIGSGSSSDGGLSSPAREAARQMLSDVDQLLVAGGEKTA